VAHVPLHLRSSSSADQCRSKLLSASSGMPAPMWQPRPTTSAVKSATGPSAGSGSGRTVEAAACRSVIDAWPWAALLRSGSSESTKSAAADTTRCVSAVWNSLLGRGHRRRKRATLTEHKDEEWSFLPSILTPTQTSYQAPCAPPAPPVFAQRISRRNKIKAKSNARGAEGAKGLFL
jgi:hypothetical protein